MEISDSRAFRPHLRGLELDRAQEKFLATVLRSPGLWSSAAVKDRAASLQCLAEAGF